MGLKRYSIGRALDCDVVLVQVSRSVDQTVAVLNSSLELLAHRVELRYQVLRYLVWFIPTLGFLGTVIGIGSTLALVPEDGRANLFELSQSLTVAFDTTIVALAESAILVFAMNTVQAPQNGGTTTAMMGSDWRAWPSSRRRASTACFTTCTTPGPRAAHKPVGGLCATVRVHTAPTFSAISGFPN